MIETKIIESGWHRNGILKEPKISLQGLRLNLDFVLLHEWYPLAVVEGKGGGTFIESTALEQAKHYAKIMNLPIAIATTDGSKYLGFNLENGLTQSWEKFPSPQDLWQCLGRTLDPTDPRLYPGLANFRQPTLFQALALGRALDALVSGLKRGLISMAQGSGSTLVIMQLIHKLIQSGFYQRILYVSELNADLDSLAKALKDNQENFLIINQNQELEYSHQIHLANIDYLIKLNNLIDNSKESTYFYDLLITRNAKSIDKIIASNDYIHQTNILAFSTPSNRKLSYFPEKPIFEYSLEDTVANISVPEGFRTVLLGDISEITLGLRPIINSYTIIEDTGNLKPEQAYLLVGKNILDDGTINFNESSRIRLQDLSEIKHLERYLAQAGDILMSRVTSPIHKRVAIVPDNIEGTVVFSDKVIRIRVDQTKAKPSDILDFLRSDSGQNLAQRFASSLAGMPWYSPSSLAQTPIFIPENDSANNAEKLSTTAVVIRQIKEEILPFLETLNEPSETANVEKIDIEVIAQQLHQIANILVPLSLTERVISRYPTPISLAYRRFHDSKFNVYEQVQRLRDVYEATSFFVYNLVLADLLRRLDPKTFFIKDKNIRRAYNGYSMATRIDLVKEVANIARLKNNLDIFIPELVGSPFPHYAEQLKDLRNSLSHTATATESKQRQILSDYQPIVEDLLSGLEFFEDYRLVRVPSLYRKGGQFIYRMEVYQGTVPHLDEQAANDDSPLEELIEAEYNHLVMLNNSGKILDLHPLYQLVENEQTQYESHICFFKQRKQKEQKLEGESVLNSKVIELDGFDEFDKLQSNILEILTEEET
ncbi:DEAD/DEAH box helicase family protein [Nostoc sp. LEGE 06077]|uniref:DEAD/DEAH box helicase family protein n=1 Tax=Nostoc sp. LEGE 06077 TaxID=915325 RepID=UPI001882575E|nr:DEAD/DEAH box helicase family protein [Nostoc sp. LEGE 06077]MBE9210732.1 DEAD/DEAH box helicase family protein [Nostoc sp. LEGE 06077]